MGYIEVNQPVCNEIIHGSLSVCPCDELNFTVMLDSSLSSKVHQARHMRKSLCFLILTTVVVPRVCYQLSSLVH